MYQDGQISATELSSLRKTCRELHESPVRVLRSLNISNPEEIQASLQRAFRIPAITDRLVASLDESFKALIPIDIALHYSVFAIAEDNNNLHVAMEDPSDKGTIHRLEFFLNRRIVPAAATVNQIADALSRLYDALPEQMKLTTSIESSRGIVAGIKVAEVAAEASAAFHTQRHVNIETAATYDEEEAMKSLTERAVAAGDTSIDSFNDDSFSAPEETQAAQPTDTGLSFEELSAAGQSLEPAASDENTALREPTGEPEMDLSGLQPGGIVDFGELSDSSTETNQETAPETSATVAPTDSVFTTFDATKEHMSSGDVILFDNFTPPSAPTADVIVVEEPSADATLTDDLLADATLTDDLLADATLTDDLLAGATLTDDLLAGATLTDDLLADSTPADDPAADVALGEDLLTDIASVQELTASTREDLITNINASSPPNYAALKSGINSCLIKLSLAKNRTAAVEILNTKLSSCALSIRSNDDGTITANLNGVEELFSLGEDAPQISPSGLREALFPVLKRLAKLK
jgi:hypothetical protein